MKRVLIIDDEPAVLHSLRIMLAQAGRFEVEVLSDSTAAFAVLEGGRFDALVLDMDMPAVHGLDVLRHARRRLSDLRVIVVTGLLDVPLAVEAMKLGAFDYLCKPVSAACLVACLDRALERPALDPGREHAGGRDEAAVEAWTPWWRRYAAPVASWGALEGRPHVASPPRRDGGHYS